jgi:hypothetical protein
MSDWLIPLVALAIGVGLVIGGIHRYRTGRAFLESAHRVPGMVAGIHRVETTDSYEFFPVLRFRTLEGAEVETVGQTRGGSYELTRLKGTAVTVLYDPRNPRTARMDTSSGRGLAGSAGMAAIGSVFAVLGIVMLFFMAT